MKRSTILRATGHVAALLAGAGLAWAAVLVRQSDGGPEVRTSPAGGNRELAAAPSAGARRPATTSDERVKAYRQAWAELMRKKLPFATRRHLQGKLLAEWVEVDPEGAIATALDSLETENSPTWNTFILQSLKGKMIDQPALFWPMIRDQRFGLATAHVRNLWIATVGKSDPALMASYFDELQPQSRMKAVNSCLEGLKASPDKAKAFLYNLAALPDTPESRGLWKATASYLAGWKSEDLVAGITAAKSEGEREMYLEGFTSQWAGSMSEIGQTREELEGLPEAVRKEAAMKLLDKSYYPAQMVDVADFLMEQGDWAAVAKSIAPRLHEVPARDPAELAAWAADLPEREETEDLYRTAIRQHINKDPAKAREWIGEMPAGWKRDNALAEYVNSSLHARNDPAAAAWAMGQIESPSFRQTAEGMQEKWAARPKK